MRSLLLLHYHGARDRALPFKIFRTNRFACTRPQRKWGKTTRHEIQILVSDCAGCFCHPSVLANTESVQRTSRLRVELGKDPGHRGKSPRRQRLDTQAVAWK